MGDAARRRGTEAGLPGDILTASRRLLRDVPGLRWGVGKDTSLCGALEAALRPTGETRAEPYDWLMGCSGAAFGIGFDPERWDPSAASPHARVTLERAARAAGARIDRVDPPFDEELRELIWARIVESIDAGIPPLVRGLGGGPEFGVLVGYDTDARVLFARTYAHAEQRDPARLGFDVFAAEAPPVPVFLERTKRPSDAELVREALRQAARIAREGEHDPGESYLGGIAALEAWIAGLAAPVPPREAAARAFADWWTRASLHDARRAAARYLRAVRGLFPDRSGADLLRAAEAYGYVADEAAKGGVGAFDAPLVNRFLDPGLRRGWARALERALAHERDAMAALASATP